MKMRVVDYIMEQLYNEGAEHVFFVPGTGCMFLTDALARNKDIEAVSVHHEQAAGWQQSVMQSIIISWEHVLLRQDVAEQML